MMKSRQVAYSFMALPLWGRLVEQPWVRIGALVSNLFQDSQSEEMLKW